MGCFRYLLLVACPHVLLTTSFIPDLEHTTIGIAEIECNGLQFKDLYQSYQQWMTESPLSALQIASHLFSDLNQWMLKVLLVPCIPTDLMTAPRGEYRNASQLAAAAGVSPMSAFRFTRQLRLESFLDESDSPLGLVRLDELLRRWQSENMPERQFPADGSLARVLRIQRKSAEVPDPNYRAQKR